MRKTLSLILVSVLIFTQLIPIAVSADTGVSAQETKLRNEFNSLAKVYVDAEKKLKAAYDKNPDWYLDGEIMQKEKSYYILWGTAVPEIGEPPASHPGWATEPMNIKVMNPNKNFVEYQDFSGGPYFYLREESGYNVFGGKVRVLVYGAPTKEIVTLQGKVTDATKKLQSSKNNLIKYINDSFQQKIKAQPNSSDVYKAYGDSLYDIAFLVDDQSLVNQAMEKYKKAIQLNPKNAGANIRLGCIYISDLLTEPDEAAAYTCFSNAAAVDPDALIKAVNNLEGYKVAGKALYDIQKFDKAAVLLKKAAAAGDNSFETGNMLGTAYINIANAYYDAKAYQNAATAYGTVLDVLENTNSFGKNIINSDDDALLDALQAHIGLGKSYMALGSKDKAYEEFETAIKMHEGRARDNAPEDFYMQTLDAGFYQYIFDLYKTMGEVYCADNKIPEAYDYFKKALAQLELTEYTYPILELDTESANTHYVLGCLYYKYSDKNKDFKQRYVEEFEKAYKLDSNNARILNAMAFCEYEQKCEGKLNKDVATLREIRGYLEKAIQLDPGFRTPYNNLYAVLYDIQEATDDFYNKEINELRQKCDAAYHDDHIGFMSMKLDDDLYL